jgi:hypothetical protein
MQAVYVSLKAAAVGPSRCVLGSTCCNFFFFSCYLVLREETHARGHHDIDVLDGLIARSLQMDEIAF